jgi:hypothetical protein
VVHPIASFSSIPSALVESEEVALALVKLGLFNEFNREVGVLEIFKANDCTIRLRTSDASCNLEVHLRDAIDFVVFTNELNISMSETCVEVKLGGTITKSIVLRVGPDIQIRSSLCLEDHLHVDKTVPLVISWILSVQFVFDMAMSFVSTNHFDIEHVIYTNILGDFDITEANRNVISS